MNVPSALTTTGEEHEAGSSLTMTLQSNVGDRVSLRAGHSQANVKDSQLPAARPDLKVVFHALA